MIVCFMYGFVFLCFGLYYFVLFGVWFMFCSVRFVPCCLVCGVALYLFFCIVLLLFVFVFFGCFGFYCFRSHVSVSFSCCDLLVLFVSICVCFVV